MRKILLALILSFSIVAFSKEYNVYLGGGFNFFNDNGHLNQIKNQDDFKKFVEVANKKKDNHFDKSNFNVKLEITKNLTKNIEIGVGGKFIHNAPFTYSVNKEDYPRNSQDDDAQKIKELDKFGFSITSSIYNSIPIYATLKYKFKDNSKELRPYVKVDLGYSFNIGVKKPKFEYIVEGNKNKQSNGKDLKSSFGKIKKKFDDMKVTSKNGIYAGLFAGVEYKNVFLEVGGTYNGGAIIVNYSESGTRSPQNKTIYINSGDFKLSTNIGIKF